MIIKFFKILFGGGVLTITLAVIFIFAHYNDTADEKKDCAVIFGAAVWNDGGPSHALYDRTMTGVKLYKNKTVKCLILSGAQSAYGVHEAEVMREIIFSNGISNQNLFMDKQGLNTLATIENLSKDKSYIFVSNDFHLARISMLARRSRHKNFELQKADYNFGRYKKEPQFFVREVISVIYYGLELDKVANYFLN